MANKSFLVLRMKNDDNTDFFCKNELKTFQTGPIASATTNQTHALWVDDLHLTQ
jgi:hypothetical protein